MKDTYSVVITIEHTGLVPLLKFLVAHYPKTTVATFRGDPALPAQSRIISALRHRARQIH